MTRGTTEGSTHAATRRRPDAERWRLIGSVLATAPDAMIIVDADGTIVQLNAQAERLFGYAPGELLGQSIDRLVPEGRRAAHGSHRAAYLADSRSRPMGAGSDLEGRRKDGAGFPAEISLAPMHTDEGVFVTAAIRDITERRRVDAKFRLMLEAAPDAVVIVDQHGTILLVNSQTEKLFGYPREQLIGNNVDMLVPERLRGRHGGFRMGYVKDPGVRAMGSGIELFGLRADGSEVPVEISLSPLETDEGQLVASSIRDVTDRNRANEILRNAHLALSNKTRDLELVNRQLESFSYSVAHDLRAPLRGMLGFAQILATDYHDKLDDEGHDALTEIVGNARKMGALIDALLALSQVTRAPLEPDMVDLGAFARSSVDDLQRREPERVVTVDITPDLFAYVDPRLARALMENLVSNAWKFTALSSDARIEIGRRHALDGTDFFVRDNGAGFDMDYVSKLFAPFQRLHTAGPYAGTGIGLATVQRIVHRHGGRIWAEAAVDHGATFYFRLPLAPQEIT